ncbi:MAG TPA: FG-GAP-like repeat-containing protein [Kofleriaceae bacterium]|nr:FG-GAP-like repeat-containing protein [Kofleriaceae bacterium]
MKRRPVFTLFAVCTSIAGCLSSDDEAVTEAAEAVAPPSAAYFKIQSLGNRCVDAGAVNTDGVGPLVIRTCSSAQSQIFQFAELDAMHDVMIKPFTSSRCVGVNGALAEGKRVTLEPCNTSSPGQRFAWDGDALLMGTQAAGVNVSRNLTFETLDGDTRENTPIEVDHRDLSDAEFWRVIPISANQRQYPHTGFVIVGDEIQLQQALVGPAWGRVIVVAPMATDDIVLRTIPDRQVLPDGATLRGNRKFVFNGQRLVVPEDRPLADTITDTYFLRLGDRARVTGLRIEGNHAAHGVHNWGLEIGDPYAVSPPPPTPLDPAPPFPAPPNAIIDHVDLSHWSEAQIQVWGSHAGSRDLYDSAGRFDCPGPEENRGELGAQIVGNFLHHGQDYGVVVSAGGAASIRGNLIFAQYGHNITASYVGFNRYDAHDNLFTSQEEREGKHAIFDVHGSCNLDGRDGSHYWVGGIAGDRFDVGWSSFLTDRTETVDIRGTPCDHFGFHDNVSTVAEAGNLLIDKWPDPTPPIGPATAGGYDCYLPAQPGWPSPPFTPKDDAAILVKSNNRFSSANPLRACPRRATGAAGACNTGDLAVGDFDGDGRDDLFFGSGVTWWFSSAGKAEWRFLNRMSNGASDLRFGDLDADGRTDVIAIQRNQIVVSWAGATRWFPLGSITAQGFDDVRIDDLAVGQFDSDPRADLFVSNGVSWIWASGGTGTWMSFGGYGFRTNQLRFGDFTQDGRTDVLGIVSGRWKIVPGPNAGWQTLGLAQVTNIAELVVADFDGVGGADVAFFKDNAWPNVDEWRVSRGGTASSVRLQYADRPLVPHPVGNFDLVAGADVLYWSNDLWLSIASGGITADKWSRQSMR